MFKQTSLVSDNINSNIKEMLGDILNDVQMESLNIGENLSKTQKKAFELFKKGKSIVITGPGGTGKSKLIKTMEDYIKENINESKSIYLCATTGVAAYNIGGMTINSFMGVGTGERDVMTLINRVGRNKAIVQRLLSTDILIIDEVSMMSAALFDKLNHICKHFRKSKKLFGGIQLILTGDFLQLLPIFNRSNLFSDSEPEDTRLIIESDVYQQYFNIKNKNIILLKENFRQNGDLSYMNLLLRIRLNQQTEQDIDLLNKKCKNYSNELLEFNKKGIIPIYLVSSNKKAQSINELNLKKLTEPSSNYKAVFKTSYITSQNKDIIEILKKELETQLTQKGLMELQLKKNTRVMLIKNLDVSLGLINGSVGTVIDFTSNKSPIVLFDNGITNPIEHTEWELEFSNNTVKATQIPLILAYAITLHRSQSLTLTHAILDLQDAFTDGMIYVGLSRLKTFEGLVLKTFDHNKITVNDKIVNYLQLLN